MALTTNSGMRSRVYVSSAAESTAGVAASLNKSFYLKACDVILMEDYKEVDEITGYLNYIQDIRALIKFGGSFDSYLKPDLMAWLSKFAYGASPSSALVSPSSTVYEHTYNAISLPVKTFTLFKQHAKITNYTETIPGCGVSSIGIKSSQGLVSLQAKIEGMGLNYTTGEAEPVSVDPVLVGEDVMVGTNTNLLVDGVALATGTLDANWSVDIETGYGLEATAGATNKGVTRYDLQKERMIKASFTVLETDTSNLADFLAEGRHTYEFQALGKTIDAPNSLRSLVAVKIMNARATTGLAAKVQTHGVFKLPIEIRGLIDTVSGYDVVTRVRNLQTSY